MSCTTRSNTEPLLWGRGGAGPSQQRPDLSTFPGLPKIPDGLGKPQASGKAAPSSFPLGLGSAVGSALQEPLGPRQRSQLAAGEEASASNWRLVDL